MVNRKVLIAAVIVVVILLAFGLSRACLCQESTSHLEKELRIYRVAYTVLLPLLEQPRTTGVPNQLPVSFLLEEPECAQRLLDHLQLKNVRVVHSRTTNASTADLNGSVRNDSQMLLQSSP
jgi:hypothetical protein